MADEINPLRAWLKHVGERADWFRKRTRLSSRTLYDILGDKPKNYGILTLRRIEEATGGEVTIRMMLDWLERGSEEAAESQRYSFIAEPHQSDGGLESGEGDARIVGTETTTPEHETSERETPEQESSKQDQNPKPANEPHFNLNAWAASLGLNDREAAEALHTPLETYRRWISGEKRCAAPGLLEVATAAVAKKGEYMAAEQLLARLASIAHSARNAGKRSVPVEQIIDLLIEAHLPRPRASQAPVTEEP
jgi:hypothetical protein